MSYKNRAAFNGRPFWCGSVNLLDGEIEEVHFYEEAETMGFHHTLYFSEAQLAKMDAGECVFFWIEDGRVEIDWGDKDGEANVFRIWSGRVEIVPRDYFIKEQIAEQIHYDRSTMPFQIQSMM